MTNHAHLRKDSEVLLRVEDLVVEFKVPGNKVVNAVSKVSFDVKEGETLAVVGESGCGKTTLGKALLQIQKPKSGTVRFEGNELTSLSKSDLRSARTSIQMIFQDSTMSLNPKKRILDVIAEPIRNYYQYSEKELLEFPHTLQ